MKTQMLPLTKNARKYSQAKTTFSKEAEMQ